MYSNPNLNLPFKIVEIEIEDSDFGHCIIYLYQVQMYVPNDFWFFDRSTFGKMQYWYSITS